MDRHAPNGRPAPDDISIEAIVARTRQLDVPVPQTLRGAPPAADIASTGARDPLLALAADVAVVIEAVVAVATGGQDALIVVVVVVGRKAEAVGVRAADGGGGFEGAEAEDAGDEGPEVRDVGDDDGGGGFARVPVEVDEGAVAGGEVVVAVQDSAEDDEGAEGEDAEKDDFSVRGKLVSG